MEPEEGILAKSLFSQCRYVEALPLFKRSLRDLESGQGTQLGDILDATCDLAACLLQLSSCEKALALYTRNKNASSRAFGPTNGRTISAVGGMARCLTQMGCFEEAIPLHIRVIKGSDGLEKLTAMSGYASCLLGFGLPMEALHEAKDVRKRMTRTLGADHRETLRAVHSVATCLISLRRYDKAIPLLEDAFEGRLRTLGDHPETATNLQDIATCLVSMGYYEEALPRFEQALLGALQQNLNPNPSQV